MRVGLLPGWGLSQRLARQIGIQRAKEISLSGNFVDADRALEIGLVNRVFEPEDLMPQALALARDMTTTVGPMVRQYKRLIDEGYARSFGDGMALDATQSSAGVRGSTSMTRSTPLSPEPSRS